MPESLPSSPRPRSAGAPSRILAPCACAAVAILALGPSPASHAAPAGPAQPPQASTAGGNEFDIAGGPLAEVISHYAAAANMAIAFDASQMAGLYSKGLHGRYTIESGFAALLADTGLQAVPTAPGRYTLRPIPVEQGGVTLLPSVAVVGTAPENRYVAATSTVGSKIAADRIETPYSVSVITHDQLEAQNPQTTVEVLRYLPGVHVGASDSDRRSELANQSIRGFGGAVLLDGLRTSQGGFSNGPSIDPYLLERVELLSGPPSVLYGQSAPGGAISYQSKRPTREPLHEIVLQTGSHDRKQAAFDFAGPLDADGQFLYRLTGVALETGTQVHYSEDQRIAIAPAFTWRPDADTELTLLFSYQHDPAKPAQRSLSWYGTYFDTPYGHIPTDFFIGEPGFNDFNRTQYTAGYEFEHRFNSVWTVRQKLRYMSVNGRYRDIYGGLEPDGSVSRTAWGSEDRSRAFNVDTQLEANFTTGAAQHTVLAGLDYYQNRQRTPANVWYAIPPLDLHNPVYGQPLPPSSGWTSTTEDKLEQLGIYAQDFIRYGRWRLLAGLRHDQAESWTDDRSTGARTQGPSDSALTGRAGLSYVFDNGIAPYASYAKSFEPQSGRLHPSRGGAAFRPTTGQQYEIGVKYQPEGMSSFLTLAVFDIRQQNVLTGDPINPGYSIQKGEVRSRGLELSATLSLSDQIDLVGSYSFLDIETTKGTADDTNDPVGKVPWYSPRHMASLWATYAFRQGPLAGLKAGAGVRYTGRGYTDSRQQYTLPAYTLVDLGLTYDAGALSPSLAGLELGLNVTNLFDKTYLSNCNVYSCWWGDRRRVLANLKYRW